MKLANKLLRKFGYEIRRLPRRGDLRRVHDAERSRLEEVLIEFARRQTAGSALANVDELRAYLTDRRILFFQEVLATCQDLGITWSNRKIADVGCGMGYLLRLINQADPSSELFGFDSFEAMNDLARMICPSAIIQDSFLADINDRFDIIFCTEVLEHLVDPAGALDKLSGCLTENGSLVLTVPNGRADQQPAGELREDGSAYWGHVHFWSPESWRWFLERTLDRPMRIETRLLDADRKNFALICPDASEGRGSNHN